MVFVQVVFASSLPIKLEIRYHNVWNVLSVIHQLTIIVYPLFVTRKHTIFQMQNVKSVPNLAILLLLIKKAV